MNRKLKAVVWNLDALDTVRSFPSEIQKKLGDLIFWLQLGETVGMPHSRTMPDIAPGCRELRVKGKDGIYRAFYFLKIRDKVLIFHAFQKKTQKTPKREIENGKKNFKEMTDEKK